MRSLATLALAGRQLVVLAVIASALDAQSADTSALRRNPISMSGLPGLMQVPIAAALPSGTAEFTLDAARTPSVLPALIRQRNTFMAFGFLPRLTLSARGTDAPYLLDAHSLQRRDLSVNAQLLLLEERRMRPAVALGIQDVGQGATPYFSTRFAVVSKTLFGRSNVSLGYGTGTDFLTGVFGGAGVALGRWATIIGEYDGHGVNGGVRMLPFASVADRIGIQPRVDVVRVRDNGTVVGVGFRTLLGGRRKTRLTAAPTPTVRRARALPARAAGLGQMADARGAPRPGWTIEPGWAVEVQRALVALGFENVGVAMPRDEADSVISVTYENRRFNRDELDALGVVMGVTARNSPPTIRRMRVTVRRVDVAVLTVESGVGAFRAFVDDRLAASSFASQLVFLDVSAAAGAHNGLTSGANPSRRKLDLAVTPRIETQEMTDVGAFDYRVTALADAFIQLGPGLVLNGRRGIPVTRSRTYWVPIEDPNADRLLLHQALTLPRAGRWPLTSAITQFSVGRFGHAAVGVANAMDVTLAGGRVSLASELAVFGRTFGSLDHSVALGTVRVRHPGLELTASLTAGRFRHGDSGAAAELARRFGATEMAFSLRVTEFAKMAGVRVALPLAPAREMAPRRVRLRAPDLFAQSMQAQVLAPVPQLRRDVGRLLETDHDVARVYRARDRLQPETVATHVASLRDAARRWLGEGLAEPSLRPVTSPIRGRVQ